MFRNKKFPGFENSYKVFKYFQNEGIDSNNTLQKPQNTNGSIKEQLFLSRGNKNYIPCSEKRKKVPVYEMLEFSWSLSSSMIPILPWKVKMHTEESTIPPSSKLKLLCQYEMTSIVTKSSIIDDLGVRDPPLVCLFSCPLPISGFKLEIQCPLAKKAPEKMLATMAGRPRKFQYFSSFHDSNFTMETEDAYRGIYDSSII